MQVSKALADNVSDTFYISKKTPHRQHMLHNGALLIC